MACLWNAMLFTTDDVIGWTGLLSFVPEALRPGVIGQREKLCTPTRYFFRARHFGQRGQDGEDQRAADR